MYLMIILLSMSKSRYKIFGFCESFGLYFQDYIQNIFKFYQKISLFSYFYKMYNNPFRMIQYAPIISIKDAIIVFGGGVDVG